MSQLRLGATLRILKVLGSTRANGKERNFLADSFAFFLKTDKTS
jgi:hypothetical protein